MNLHPHERSCNHTFNIYLRNRTRYQGNYVPMNRENFGYPQTLTPTNKNGSTVHDTLTKNPNVQTSWVILNISEIQ